MYINYFQSYISTILLSLNYYVILLDFKKSLEGAKLGEGRKKHILRRGGKDGILKR